ncbi:vanadium-dependent haloperoxidase [Bradyrhizobium daqingense]|uniref:PAP2 superfamily protein n=1 Tax=Bradyrhizobium daqingense TaxID=993502 RepID=A0A562LDE2_9BRAD|nr:vanadium-dependent haloperoxidase [Bradyrhizobium daqingense]TWI05702.1 PAP2 superfamily protein [Bradyrhizobium daqingense]UFS91233.1 vanadium-dependent haloperoxidase [Bradyrhizobium daqingense]
MKTFLATRSPFLIVAALAVCVGTARADVIMDWNAKADAIAAEKKVLPVPQARTMSMLHVAMFEAVNAIDRRYTPYKLDLVADRSTSKEAAAAAAAYNILLTIYPDQKSALDTALHASLSGIPDTDGKANGIELGTIAASGVIALRRDDGSNAQESYRPATAAGVYVPTVVPLGTTVGSMTPWVMTSVSQFRPAPPPALDSETWSRDVNEIREVGARNSTTRTAEQTDIGRFWFLVGPPSFNPIVRQVALAKHMDLVDCARLFALAEIAGNDAIVAVLDAKYHYNLWRPTTAIRNADITHNPKTPRDSSWLPLGETPMHPEYPCAHCIVSASVSTVLRSIAGDDIGELSVTSPTAPGVTRKWSRIQDYSDEVSNARIYAGFHYRFSTEVGKDMGRKIGDLTVATQLRGLEARAEPKQ